MAPPTRYRAVVHAADLTLATARGAEEATTYLPGPRRRIFFHACHGVRFVSFCVSGKLFTAQHSCARALNRVTVAKLMDATMMLDEIAVFVQVVEAGSFTAAARKRAVPKSTLSRGVARLEDALRTPLLQRTARKVALTDAGRAFYDRVAPHVSGLRDAAMLAGEREEQPRGLLRVTAPGDVGEALLADALVRFSMRYPQLKLEVDLSVRMVNIVEEGFDVAIRASNKLKDSTLVARKIADVEVHYYATPSYLAKHGTPKNPDDLAKHECVLFRASDGYGVG